MSCKVPKPISHDLHIPKASYNALTMHIRVDANLHKYASEQDWKLGRTALACATAHFQGFTHIIKDDWHALTSVGHAITI